MTLRLTPPCIADGPTLTAAEFGNATPAGCPLWLPRGYLTAGKRLQLRASGKVSTLTSRGPGPDLDPGSMRFQLRMGDVIVWDGGAVPLTRAPVESTDLPWALDVDLRVLTSGALTATTLDGAGTLTCAALLGAGTQPTAGAVVSLPYRAAPVAGSGVDAWREHSVELWYAQGMPGGALTVSGYALFEV